MQSARAAFVLLSRVPVGGFPFEQRDWRWACAWFPLVGGAIGLVMALAWWAGRFAGSAVGAACAVGAGMLVTGALHEDGLADTADAFGARCDRARTLAILKDSRIGAYGACALVVAVALRVALLVRLDGACPWALVLTQALARLPAAWLMATLPHVSSAPKSPAAFEAGPAQAVIATAGGGMAITAVGVARLVAPSRAVALLAVCSCVVALCGWRFRAWLGGVTGDLLGASEQITEVGLLFVLAASW